jgi:glycogen(starch) synthase
MPSDEEYLMRPRVLHLAYEDPRAPGGGGGSVRTREINERLADDFRITVVSAPFPAAAARAEAGVRYDHLGLHRGHKFVRQLSYFARIPSYVRQHQHRFDLIVEDFGAPISTVGVPRFTGKPVVGVVQWLFAHEKAEQYHLPFATVEDRGLASHSRLIAVSDGMADALRHRNPAARVDVVPNGLPDAVLADRTAQLRRDFLFLGRLDVAHKGLDLLLESFASISDRVAQNLVIAGEGAGQRWLIGEIERRRLGSRVRLIGRVPESERFDVLARYEAVVMPSRYESFGMVAAEAAAVGTPCIGYDIPCLRSLVADELLVPAFDTEAFAATMERVATTRTLQQRLQRTLPATVSHLSWDRLAAQQGELYLEALDPVSPAGRRVG